MANGLISLEDKLRWVRPFFDGTAAMYFDTLNITNSWDEWRSQWIERYTIWGTHHKRRRYFRDVRQETENLEEYIAEFLRRLRLLRDPEPAEAHHVFVEGLLPEFRIHVYEQGVENLSDALRVARAFWLKHIEFVSDTHLPRPMSFVRTKWRSGSHRRTPSL